MVWMVDGTYASHSFERAGGLQGDDVTTTYPVLSLCLLSVVSLSAGRVLRRVRFCRQEPGGINTAVCTNDFVFTIA